MWYRMNAETVRKLEESGYNLCEDLCFDIRSHQKANFSMRVYNTIIRFHDMVEDTSATDFPPSNKYYVNNVHAFLENCDDNETIRNLFRKAVLRGKDVFAEGYLEWGSHIKVSVEITKSEYDSLLPTYRRLLTSYPDEIYRIGVYAYVSKAVSFLERSDAELNWGETVQRNISVLKEIDASLRSRYAMYTRPKNGLTNVCIDNYAPYWIMDTGIMQLEVGVSRTMKKIPSTAVTISPWFSYLFGVRQLETQELCDILGFSKDMLRVLVRNTKRKKFTLALIGYGGTGVNTIKWLTDICNYVGVTGLFENVIIWEDDKVEFSNLLRFPKNHNIENEEKGTDKLCLLTTSEKRTLVGKYFYTYTRRHNIEEEAKNHPQRPKTHVFNLATQRIEAGENVITYGAPSIPYRAALSKYGNFVSATHSGDSCQMWLNPEQNTSLQVESYGLIGLTSFFMNQLRMAIGLLETLSSPTFDPLAKDQKLLSYQFDGVSKIPTSKKIAFNLEHSGLMLDEGETNV